MRAHYLKKTMLISLGWLRQRIRSSDGFEIWIRFIDLFGVTNINEPYFFIGQHLASLTSDENRLLEVRGILAKQASRIRAKYGKRKTNAVAIIPISTSFGIGTRALETMGSKPL